MLGSVELISKFYITNNCLTVTNFLENYINQKHTKVSIN